jgi:hypothetical protein
MQYLQTKEMKMKNKIIATAVIGILTWNSSYAGISPAFQPKLVPINAEEILLGQGGLRGEITRGLQTQALLDELAKIGVDKKEVELRLAAMSDSELQQIRDGFQRQAGGDVVVISVTTLLLIIIVLLLIAR